MDTDTEQASTRSPSADIPQINGTSDYNDAHSPELHPDAEDSGNAYGPTDDATAVEGAGSLATETVVSEEAHAEMPVQSQSLPDSLESEPVPMTPPTHPETNVGTTPDIPTVSSPPPDSLEPQPAPTTPPTHPETTVDTTPNIPTVSSPPPIPSKPVLPEQAVPLRVQSPPQYTTSRDPRKSYTNDSSTSSRPSTPRTLNPNPSGPSEHRRSLTIAQGNNVSVVLISSALDTIAASKEAKRSAPLRESTQRALELVRNNQGGDRPREVFEPLRLACETRSEKLMIASLDCISKLISYSFFAEAPSSAHAFVSPPPSPHVSVGNTTPSQPNGNAPAPSLVDLVAHTITACHTETTPETVSLQIVKALLSLVLSPTVLIHHSSLLKAVRTVYNVFLLSTDPVNQMVAQGGLTQMVHHVFTRCKISPTGTASATPLGSMFPAENSQSDSASLRRDSLKSTSDTPSRPLSNGRHESEGSERRDSESSTSVPSVPQSGDTDEDTAASEGGLNGATEDPKSRMTL